MHACCYVIIHSRTKCYCCVWNLKILRQFLKLLCISHNRSGCWKRKNGPKKSMFSHSIFISIAEYNFWLTGTIVMLILWFFKIIWVQIAMIFERETFLGTYNFEQLEVKVMDIILTTLEIKSTEKCLWTCMQITRYMQGMVTTKNPLNLFLGKINFFLAVRH